MFDPVSIAMMAGGQVANAVAGGMDRRAERHYNDMNLLADMRQVKQDLEAARLRNLVLGEYRDNARGFATENQETFTGGLGSFFPGQQTAAMTGATEARGGTISDAIGAPPQTSSIPLRDSVPDVVRQAYDKSIGDAFSRSQTQGGAMAKVGAYGDVMRDNAAKSADMGSSIGTVNNLARGNAALLPHEQDLVAFKTQAPIFRMGQPEYSPWSSVLKGVGQLSTVAGARGLGSSFGAPGVNAGVAGGGYVGTGGAVYPGPGRY